MASDTHNDTGSKDRATVALVSEKVDGLKSLVEAGFVGVQRQLDLLAGVPAKIADHEARLKNLESDADFRRGPAIGHLIAGLALLVSLAAVVVAVLS